MSTGPYTATSLIRFTRGVKTQTYLVSVLNLLTSEPTPLPMVTAVYGVETC